MPVITVVTAVFNGEDHLRQAIQSILAQTHSDLEYVIVDDGSTDGSADIVRSFDDARIRLVQNERNLGLSRSLNRGWALATGEFLARLDADDIAEPERLERQIRFLRANPDVALLGTAYREIDADGRVVAERELPTHHLAIRWALLFYCPFVHSAVVFRRVLVLERVGRYDESFAYSMDYDLWRRIACDLEVANLREPGVRVRTHGGSMTTALAENLSEGHHLRVANMARMLRWAERGIDPSEYGPRFAALDLLARGGQGVLTPGSVRDALEDLRLLLEVFCDEASLEPGSCLAHRRAVECRVATNLRKLARRAVTNRGRMGDTLQLWRIAAEFGLRAKLQPRSAWSDMARLK